jgi:hypothetical protein
MVKMKKVLGVVLAVALILGATSFGTSFNKTAQNGNVVKLADPGGGGMGG